MNHFFALHPIAIYLVSIASVCFAGAFIAGGVVMFRDEQEQRRRRRARESDVGAMMHSAIAESRQPLERRQRGF